MNGIYLLLELALSWISALERFLYLISKRTQAALLLMAVEGWESFSFSTVRAPAARASETSTRRQLESVSRISSWISSSSVCNFSTRGGTKPALRTPPAPAQGTGRERGWELSAATAAIAPCTWNFCGNTCGNSCPYTEVGLRDGNYSNTAPFINVILALLLWGAPPKLQNSSKEIKTR